MTFSGRASGAQHPKQFAAGNDVESGSPFRKTAKKIDVRVGLYGVTNQVRDGLKRLIEYADMTMQRLFAVDVGRCTDFCGYLAERDVLAVKLAAAILEVMHEEL